MSSRTKLKIAIVALILAFPHLPFVPFSVLGNVNVAAQFALVALSLVILTGWVGQISLGHAGLVGIGAYVTALVTNELRLPFPLSMVCGGLAAAAVAAVLGAVALRVRGLYLAVATLIFSWMAHAFLFRQGWLAGHSSTSIPPLGKKGAIPYFDWTQRNTYYYAAWAAVALAIYVLANIRDSKSGRAFFAVRGSEVAAASLGIDVMRAKLVAFAVSGALAGAAGSLVMVGQQTVSPDQFSVSASLFYLSIPVVGGLSSLGGAVAASLLFAFLNEAFFRAAWLSGYLEVVSALLLAMTLLLYRGGLAAIPAALGPRLRVIGLHLRERVGPAAQRSRRPMEAAFRGLWAGTSKVLGIAAKTSGPLRLRIATLRPRSARSNGSAVPVEPPLDLTELRVGQPDAIEVSIGNGHARAESAQAPVDSPAAGARRKTWREMAITVGPLPTDRELLRPMIEAEGITVQFGGLAAVRGASLSVREGEIVGLIGPNGAGKTTLFNAIAGLNEPAEGRVSLFGQDVTNFSVHRRAQLGLGRTFQAIQLFGQLTVFENVLVAADQHNRTGLVSHLAVTHRSIAQERAARRQARRALELLELDSVADRRTADLPFGVLRMVEVARALATGARLIMLDEPASGLDNTETDRLMDVLRFIRSLGISLLLIEHDIRMVTGVSDYMYVLESGAMLASGRPKEIQRDPRVIAAYLGSSQLEEVNA